tara:strand:- start:389 stop:2443 length:2055 start_codon:yes stop_codon:yes gene_type:complete
MIKVFVNNKPVLVPKNTSALEACDAMGVSVPRFCYHERLNVAGNCRMCLVEIEKAPKPIASCAFPVAPNMRIYTETPLVHKARENVLEFLLINHPLDCPICDQGGECDLQEQTLVFGSDRSRFFSSKRSVEDKNCGLLIKTIMSRCIHCTRCVRFFQDVAGQEDFGTTLRGQDTEIGTYVGKNLNSELSGNIIDLCPVGALTSKPYAFTARPWEIKSIETVDVLDGVGSNIRINFKETEILRVLPALNDSLNEEWISDKTRFSFDGLKIQRIGNPFLSMSKVTTNSRSLSLDNEDLSKISWRKALLSFTEATYKINSDQILFVCGNSTDLETIQVLKKVSQSLNISLISETFLDSTNNLMAYVKSNTTFKDILDSDLCLSIGTNVRFEASLLNVRLKKRSRKGSFVKASIGLNENLTYQNDSLGNSLETLVKIAEGKHAFCQKLAKAKKPFIILGSSVTKRLDSKTTMMLVNKIAEYTTIIGEKWFGINHLPLTVNTVGKSFSGINMKSKLDMSHKKLIYCVGLDSYEILSSKNISNDAFIVAQTPHANPFLKMTNLILPSSAFTEKEGTFLNLEGRIQKTSAALTCPGLARDDSKIIKALFQHTLKKELKNSSLCVNISNFENNKTTFTKSLILKKRRISFKLIKTSLKSVLANFFVSNAITSNSLVMAKCASIFKKNYSNFI